MEQDGLLALPARLERDDEPMRLVQWSVAKDDPDPKAISCYGLYLPGGWPLKKSRP